MCKTGNANKIKALKVLNIFGTSLAFFDWHNETLKSKKEVSDMKGKGEAREYIMKTCFTFMILVLSIHSICAGDKTQIAIWRVDKVNVTDAQKGIVEQFIRISFVNSGKYTVLDRKYIDVILHEQSLKRNATLSIIDVAHMGKVLNVQQIVTGTLMRLNGEYFLEVMLIDVETSSIKNSKTMTCKSEKQLPYLAQKIVESICGFPIDVGMETLSDPDTLETLAIQENVNLDYYSLKTDSVKVPVNMKKEERRMKLFRMLDFSSYDYDRFKRSDLSIQEWADNERRVESFAGIFGVITGTSGFFYTRNYSNGAFVTIAKIIGIIGMVQNFDSFKKGGKNKYLAYSTIFAAVTCGDAVGSVIAAKKRNSSLTKLRSAGADFGLIMNNKNIKTYATINF